MLATLNRVYFWQNQQKTVCLVNSRGLHSTDRYYYVFIREKIVQFSANFNFEFLRKTRLTTHICVYKQINGCKSAINSNEL